MANKDWTLGFIGAGVMAEVMIAGLIADGVVEPAQIRASNRRAERSIELNERYGIACTLDNAEVAQSADMLVLSVKPQTLPKVLEDLHDKLRPGTSVLSIVAGARIEALQRGLNHKDVSRCMPNLPCRIRKGMTVWYTVPEVREESVAAIVMVLSVMGETIRVHDESHVDRATAVNGTGPAIVAQFVKALLEAATFIGEPRSLAHDTVLATLAGTVEMIRRSDVHVAQLIDEVTSPGGTTSRALQVLKKGRFSAVLTDSIDAAHERTVALGEALDTKINTAPSR